MCVNVRQWNLGRQTKPAQPLAPGHSFLNDTFPPIVCLLSKVNRIYAVVSSLTSFYLPLPVMFYVYFRILLIAERQAREIRQLQMSLQQNGNINAQQLAAQLKTLVPLSESNASSLVAETDLSGPRPPPKGLSVPRPCPSDAKRHVERNLRRRSRQLLTDTKAIRTLGMIMGVFCLFWLPFFVMYLVSAFCDSCDLSYEWRSALTWLGYVNSSINPIIYTFMNKDFKTAFRRVLCCSPIVNVECNEQTMDEMSTTSRNARYADRMHIAFDLPTPSVSRTPSATPETMPWPVVDPASGQLVVPGPPRAGSIGGDSSSGGS